MKINKKIKVKEEKKEHKQIKTLENNNPAIILQATEAKEQKKKMKNK